ncbi:phage tail spike protein [Streptococcus oralis]|uniref:phage tail spike protein n=1 Tax=Streptococcus oralis TaxID=1303 RepID=UPI00345B2995
MLLTIHDSNLRKVTFIDNDKQDTLNYFNDTWTRYLETGSSTFDFTVFKKAIISDVGKKRAYNSLNEKAFVSFRYKGRTYLHTIRKIEENEKVIKCYGINLNLELINEYSIPYKSPKAMSFKEFCEAMDLLNYTFLKIGINEVANKKISAEWEGTDTKLNRLLSLAKKFGAEIEFDTRLNADSSIKSFTVNVYHEHDDSHQGVGQISPKILKYGKNLKTITRAIDKTGIYNTVVPTGKDDKGNVVDIRGLGAWSVNNAKGEREFYQSGAALYAPLSMQMYPSTFTHSTGDRDQWIRKDMTVESSNPEVIRSAAYRELKKNCYPAVTYEAEDFADLEIGDTVKVYDDGFSPTLLLEMRVSEQVISFTNPKNNKTTFSNAKALENRLSQGIQQQLDRMIEDAKPYTIKLATDNGIAFKNGQGQTIVTPTLMKGNKVINSGWRWVVDGEIKATSPSYTVRAADINQKMVLTVSAWVDNKEVASEQLTLINTSDGLQGQKGDTGPKGDPGPKGDRGEKGALDENQLKEIKTSIDTKADQGLTQEQLNALNEKAGVIQAELEAKASISTLNQIIAEYKSYTLQNDNDKAQSEKDLASLSQRLIENVRNLKDMAERWNFLDKYFQVGNEGIVFGEQNGNTCAKMSSDRFSIFSAGNEVMYISQGTLFIENGIFSKTIQIGRFREEQYYLNPDMNVIRYVG